MQILDVVQSCYALPSVASASVTKRKRLYSTTWLVAIPQDGDTQTYIVKQASAGAEKQARLSQRADDIFLGQPIHQSAEIKYVGKHDLTIARLYSGRTLEALLAESGVTRPVRWYGDLRRTVCLAGAWLRRYHDAGRLAGSVSAPLMRYLEERSEKLDRLAPDSRRKLVRLVEGDIRDEVVVTHGDFSPGNILSNGYNLCVIDFGIREWVEMSPWWDVVTLLVSLDRQALFKRTSLLYWARPVLSRLRAIFWAAYSERPPADARSFLACMAVRHFSFAGDLTGEALREDERARWHLHQLKRILDQT